MFEIRRGNDGNVRLIGRLDASAAEQALSELARIEGPLVADCAELDYISSAGLGVFMQTFKRLRTLGHGLRLINVPPRIRNVFRYAGLDQVFQME
jgi:anti-sigma B factor antagonist